MNLRAWRKNDAKGEYIICNHSVTHKDMPEKKGFVRCVRSICWLIAPYIHAHTAAMCPHIAPSCPHLSAADLGVPAAPGPT